MIETYPTRYSQLDSIGRHGKLEEKRLFVVAHFVGLVLLSTSSKPPEPFAGSVAGDVAVSSAPSRPTLPLTV